MNKYYVIIIAIMVCITDQILKYLILSRLYFAEDISVAKNFLSITKVYNTGAAFSLFEESTGLLIIFSLIVSVAIILYILKKDTKLELPYLWAWGLILGGTVGNLLDRLIHGYVVDFIRLDFLKFPIFNFADLSINIGAFIVIVYSLIKLRKTAQEL